MKRLPVALLMLGLVSLRAQEVRVGLGVFTFAKSGVDLQADVHPKLSHWQIGFKYVHWTDASRDPFTGRVLTETTQTRFGPFVNYLFRPDASGSWYLEGAVFHWSKAEQARFTGEIGRASITSPYLGGGFTGTMGRHFFYNFGLTISPGAKLTTRTSVSSETDSGGFDIQILTGIRF